MFDNFVYIGRERSVVEYSEHNIVSGNTEIILSVWEYETPRAVIIFIPATMIHPLCYEPLLRGFAEYGYAVVGLHPVGHGKSPRNVRRFTLRDIMQNTRDAVSFALERYKKPVIMMGTSQGGILAAWYASEDDRIAAVFPHNLMMPELSETLHVTRFPKWLRYVYRPWLFSIKILAALLPDMQVAYDVYLDPSRIYMNKKYSKMFVNDTLSLRKYPLCFLASMLTTRFPGLVNGSVRCPIYAIADKRDKLFEMSYIQTVFDRLSAPYKEMILFNTGEHMLMVTHPQEVCETLAPKIHEALTRSATTCLM